MSELQVSIRVRYDLGIYVNVDVKFPGRLINMTFMIDFYLILVWDVFVQYLTGKIES